MAADQPGLPQQSTSTEVTPAQAVATIAQQIVESKAQDAKTKFEDSLDIRDPGQPKPDDAPAAPEKPAPRTIPGATPDGGLTEELLDRAVAIDIPEVEARAMQPATLRRMVTRLEQASGQRQPQPQLAPAQPPQFQPEPLPLEDEFDSLPQLDPEKYEPELVQALQARDRHFQERVKRAEQQALQTQQQFQAQAQQVAARENQRQFNQLEKLFQDDKDMVDVFGDGKAHELVGTKSHAARQRVAVRMDSIAREYVQSGQQPPAIEELYEEAKAGLYRDHSAKKAERKVAEKAKARAGQFIARPTASNVSSELPKGVERAEQAVAAKLRERYGNS